MGADLILTGLELVPGRQPDWDAGEKWIEGLGDSELIEVAEQLYWDYEVDAHDNLDRESIQKQLRAMLVELQSVVDAPRRDTARIDWYGGLTLILSGGMSHGDSPTDSFDVLGDSENIGLAKACGFGLGDHVVLVIDRTDLALAARTLDELAGIDAGENTDMDSLCRIAQQFRDVLNPEGSTA